MYHFFLLVRLSQPVYLKCGQREDCNLGTRLLKKKSSVCTPSCPYAKKKGRLPFHNGYKFIRKTVEKGSGE